MKHFLYKVILTDNPSPHLSLPLEASMEGAGKAAFGTIEAPCTVAFHDQPQDAMKMSKGLAELLHFFPVQKTNILLHEGTIHLGPLFGIFTAGFTDSILRPAGERSLFFAKLLSIDSAAGMPSFLFGAHHINWEKGIVNGFIYGKDGWEQRHLPLPSVVYDRLPNRRLENHRALKLVKARLTKEYAIPWYNPGFFNKWEIHQLLIKDSTARRYLPETILHPSLSQLEQLLSDYRSVYLKPVNGSLGNGIFQLMYSREDAMYYSRHRDPDSGENKLRKYPALEHFFKHSFQGKHLENYLAQQGIKLEKFQQCPIDFRVHTNKDRTNEWKVTAIAAKISGRGSATTHLNNGGIVKTLEELYSEPKDRLLALDELTSAAICLSRSIDGSIDGMIGEIGFDLGIDNNGRVWMFEANSKPGRSIFDHPKLKTADINARRHTVDYALYLAERAIKNPEDLPL
ncbi:YheC/YheD family protein [Metabacillus lacus]|nr:YheC/YheD family protein [Metabacillus lacus]